MNHEINRLQTFHEWPANSAVSPSRIAKAGFFYTGTAQIVQCFLCGTTVSEWNYSDQVMALHRLANPECPFVVDPTATCNVPLIATNNDTMLLNSSNTNHSSTSQNSQGSSSGEANLTRYSHRLSTFENWPIPAIVSPERLARSGFYYLQQADMVKYHVFINQCETKLVNAIYIIIYKFYLLNKSNF